MRLAIKFPEYVAQNTTKQKAMIPAVKRNGRRSGCPVPPEWAIVFIYFKMRKKDQNIIHVRFSDGDDRCPRQNPPPAKIILAKAKRNGHRFFHIYICISSIPSQIDKCVIWPIFF